VQTLGIDLGTSNTVAAIGNHVFEISDDGRTTLPSVVAFLPSGRVRVGETARRRRAIDCENTIYSSKRIIGRRWDEHETASFRDRYPFHLVEDTGGTPLFVTRAGRHSATQIAGQVLVEVLDRVRSLPGEFAVEITVPAAFRGVQREATAEAAALAGLRRVELLDEPTATAYAYLTLPRSTERAVVYDLGGGTFDCAVIDCTGATPHTIAHVSDLFLGGDDIDRKLAGWVARFVLEKYNWDLTNYSEIFDRLLARCEEAKIRLSHQHEAMVPLSQVDPECPVAEGGVTVTRRLLDELCTDLMRRSFVICDETLRAAALRPWDIDSVFLAGGTTLLPMIQEGVRAYFGRPGLLEFDPTEVVARGACLARRDS
jgi:molecular chaperone DnaK